MSCQKLIGSTLGSAYIFRFMPGTSSSIFFWITLTCIHYYFPLQDFVFVLIALLTVVLGLYSLKGFEEEDPKNFTLDEAFAICFTIMFFKENLALNFLCFVLFRVFDILKPFGIKFMEKCSTKHRLFSVYVDDFIAGIYAILLTYLINYLIESFI